MDRLEERIREEYKNMKLPDTDIAERMRRQIASGHIGESGSEDNIIEYDRKRIGRNGRHYRKIAAAAVIAISVLCTSVTIYAAVKGLTVRQLFSLIWGADDSEAIDETIACEAGIIDENNSFDGLDIKPVKVIGDVRGLYVVMKITDKDGRYIDNNSADNRRIISFGDYEMQFENGGSATYSLKYLDYISEEKEDGVRYIAFEYIGGSDGEPVSESGSVNLIMKDWYGYADTEAAQEADKENATRIAEGSYTATLSYNYISTAVRVSMSSINVCCDISSLTVMVNAVSENAQEELLEKESISLIMKDGSVVKAEAEYGLESDGEYTVVYSIEHPVIPSEVVRCD